jgi:hypothetical protein
LLVFDTATNSPLPVSTPAQVPPDSPPPILLDPSCAPAPPSVSTSAQVAVHDLQHPNPPEDDFVRTDEDDEDMYDDEEPYDLSRYNTYYSLVLLDLEQVPVTTLDDLLYYRYCFSLNESPYCLIPL